MKRFTVCSLLFGIWSTVTFAAQDPITVSVDSLTNVAGNGAIEACGTGIHKDGIKPLMITLKHADALYTTLTAPNGKWCVVFKRWTFDGHIDISATTLQGAGDLNFKAYPISLSASD